MKKISYSAVTQVYLNDNQLTFLPNDFFVAFPSLRWLDLRNNKLENLFEIDSLIHSKVQTIKKVIYFHFVRLLDLACIWIINCKSHEEVFSKYTPTSLNNMKLKLLLSSLLQVIACINRQSKFRQCQVARYYHFILSFMKRWILHRNMIYDTRSQRVFND